MTTTYHIITYGCQMNLNDSEHLAGMFEFQGLKRAQDITQADIVILNSCSVRERAERKVIGKLHELNYLRKTTGYPKEIGIAGCMPKRDIAYIKKETPFLDHIIDIDEVRQYPAKRESTDQAWVTIMYGCDNYCAYCIVPYVRGRERSRPVADILKEIAEIDKAWYPKIMLLGQNVNSYKGTLNSQDNDLRERLLYGKSEVGRQKLEANINTIDFADLLKLVHDVPGIQQIDFLTSHPKDMTDKLIETIAQLPKIGHELHFPLQAGNDRILRLMNRGYTYAQYKALVEKIRAKIPKVQIATDLIVGFPSETEEEFQDTLKAVREIRFHKVLTLAFSPRPGTKATDLPDQLPVKIRAERLHRLMKVVDEAAGK